MVWMMVCVWCLGLVDLKMLLFMNMLLRLSCIISVVLVGVVMLLVVKFMIGSWLCVWMYCMRL